MEYVGAQLSGVRSSVVDYVIKYICGKLKQTSFMPLFGSLECSDILSLVRVDDR